jgi:N-acetylglucosamine-6-sulfatase
MRRLALAVAVLVVVLAAPAAAIAAERPHNVVVVMTDDQDFRSMGVMPQTRALIAKRGTTFATSVVSFPLCCPSRATFMTGQYAHNHGVKWNELPNGGFYKLKQAETLPVWLRRAGYRTIHIGKFLNEYGEQDATEVPKGWTDWHAGVDPSTYDYYGYTLNHNGVTQTYGRAPGDYSTDVFAGIAAQAIKDARKARKPFFLNIAPFAPHTVAVGSGARMEGTPALPAPRHASRFAQAAMPRYPNFNEADISDKPAIAAFFPEPMNEDQIAALQDHWRGRTGSLLAVDDLVTRVVKALKKAGVYDDTDIVFTSDNGWILGEHRLRDPLTEDGRAAGVKYVPFEGSSRVPLMAAGPDFPKGRTVRAPVVNADLAPTILDITGAKPKLAQDGISLLRALRTPSLLAGRGVLLETFENPRGVPPYTAIRTERYRLEVSEAGFTGLYDLKLDPWELESKHDDPRYDKIEAILRRKLAALTNCKGSKCRVDVGRLPEPS